MGAPTCPPPAPPLTGFLLPASPTALPAGAAARSVIAGLSFPAFLLPLYQAAGARYGVPWEVLAAINEAETAYGQNTARSTAGAVGWMQFLPSTWQLYGVDANGDGRADPANPVDAIYAAANYLHATGAGKDLATAVFAYNHAGWYVAQVLRRAAALARLPADVTDALGLLADGRFPVAGRATIAARRGRTAVDVLARTGTRVVAAHDGRVLRAGGRRVVVRDVAGNAIEYADLRVRTAVRRGSRVRAGDTVGVIGAPGHVTVTIRPAGAHAPIDARPVLRSWRVLGLATGTRPSKTAFFQPGVADAGSILGLSARTLVRRVLGDRRIQIYPCGRRDIEAGVVDRRVLAVLEFLAAAHLDPTATSLRCGHSRLTSSGNVSEHSTGDAVDISAINGVPILGHQGPGSITETTVQRLLTLPPALQPHQIISLMTFAGAGNTMSLADHANHIHIGFQPSPTGAASLDRTPARLSAAQWRLLLARVGQLGNPPVPGAASRSAPRAP